MAFVSNSTPFANLRRQPRGWPDFSWGSALPAVTRLLADDDADVALPTCPLVRAGEPSEATFARSLAYWTALDHLLRYQLGWTFPAQGLARWLDEGRPIEYRPLALIRHVWLGDGFLVRYLAWRVEKCVDHLPSPWMQKVRTAHDEYGTEGEPVGPWQLHLEEPGEHALEPLDAEPPRLAWIHPPASEPSEALFGDHDADLDVDERAAQLANNDEAILLFEGSLESGWYGALRKAPSPHVRVVNQQHGLVGRFRISPSSGQWHTVSEEIHSWGVRTAQLRPNATAS